MRTTLTRITEQKTLSRSEAKQAMGLLLEGRATPEEIAALLVGLRARGETLDELVGFTESMRAHAIRVDTVHGAALDIVGTGGDLSGTFNISTTTAFVCRGAGVPVAKHGNRSVSSRCGSFDVLEELGVAAGLGKDGVEHCLREAGMAFMFAPLFHPALRFVMPVRRALGVRTCFNILGPLCNPAGVQHLLVGAFSDEVAEMMAHILNELGTARFITVHADNGMDEISISGPTSIYQHNDDAKGIAHASVHPADYGLEAAPVESIRGGDAVENARILRAILNGENGPARDVVLLNTAFALLAAGAAASVEEGLERAARSIDSGEASMALERLVAVSNEAEARGKL